MRWILRKICLIVIHISISWCRLAQSSTLARQRSGKFINNIIILIFDVVVVVVIIILLLNILVWGLTTWAGCTTRGPPGEKPSTLTSSAFIRSHSVKLDLWVCLTLIKTRPKCPVVAKVCFYRFEWDHFNVMDAISRVTFATKKIKCKIKCFPVWNYPEARESIWDTGADLRHELWRGPEGAVYWALHTVLYCTVLYCTVLYCILRPS